MELFCSLTDSSLQSSVNFPYSGPARHASDPFDLPGVLYPDNVSLEPVQGLPASQQSRLRGPPEQVDVRSLLATLARQQQQQQLMLQSQQGPPYPVAGNSWSLDTQPAAVQVNAEATYSLPMQVSLLGKDLVHRGTLMSCMCPRIPTHCRALLEQRTQWRAGAVGQQRAPAQRTQPDRSAAGSGATRSTSAPRSACMWPAKQ